jgi:magnesium chelatase subunit D
MKDDFPFSAVVGQQEAQLALLLAAVDPAIGGVLLRGDKGSAKSTLARGLAGLLAPDAPFVELPIGATEDRVLGSLDLRAALTDGTDRFRPGLLAAAHGGVLYVDEVNLLPDHLVDALLDAAASGVHRVERDGVSHEHPAQFLLLGSMNPEEGELRPQLLDRFGLSVEVRAPRDPAVRAEAVRRRLAHDHHSPLPPHPSPPSPPSPSDDEALRVRLAAARPAALHDDVVAFAARLAVEVGAESLRADLVLCRAAAALAGWEARADTTTDDVARVAPLALAHRRRRRPFEPPTLPPEDLRAALDNARDGGPDQPAPDEGGGVPSSGGASPEDTGRWEELAGEALVRPPAPLAPFEHPHRRPSTPTTDGSGRAVGDRPLGDGPRGLAVLPTVRAALQRRIAEPTGPQLVPDDLRATVRARPQGRTIVLAVDASGSMGTRARVEAATGAVLGLLADAYLRRDQVALVAFRGDDAVEVLPPTQSVELARTRLADLVTGGATPLAAGIATATVVARRAAAKGSAPLLVLLTDGRATGHPDALAGSRDAARSLTGTGIETLVLDAEDGLQRLGLAAELARLMDARHLSLSEVTAGAVESAIRERL